MVHFTFASKDQVIRLDCCELFLFGDFHSSLIFTKNGYIFLKIILNAIWGFPNKNYCIFYSENLNIYVYFLKHKVNKSKTQKSQWIKNEIEVQLNKM